VEWKAVLLISAPVILIDEALKIFSVSIQKGLLSLLVDAQFTVHYEAIRV
jgi:hypothetical protein